MPIMRPLTPQKPLNCLGQPQPFKDFGLAPFKKINKSEFKHFCLACIVMNCPMETSLLICLLWLVFFGMILLSIKSLTNGIFLSKLDKVKLEYFLFDFEFYQTDSCKGIRLLKVIFFGENNNGMLCISNIKQLL